MYKCGNCVLGGVFLETFNPQKEKTSPLPKKISVELQKKNNNNTEILQKTRVVPRLLGLPK